MEVVEDLRRGVSYVCPLKRAVDRRDYREITDHPSIIIAQHPDTVVQFATHNAVSLTRTSLWGVHWSCQSEAITTEFQPKVVQSFPLLTQSRSRGSITILVKESTGQFVSPAASRYPTGSWHLHASFVGHPSNTSSIAAAMLLHILQ